MGKRNYSDLWPAIVGLALGILLAFPLAAPIIGSVVSDSTATLLGSALGAGIAIAGSFWISDRAQRSQQRNAAALAASVARKSVDAFNELASAYGQPTNRSDCKIVDQEPDDMNEKRWAQVISGIKCFLKEYDEMRKMMGRIDASLCAFDVETLHIYLHLEWALEDAHISVVALKDVVGPANLLHPSRASWARRCALFGKCNNINKHFDVLAK